MVLGTHHAEIFVSYARRDNLPESLPGSLRAEFDGASLKRGWVDWCQSELVRRVSARLAEAASLESDRTRLTRQPLHAAVSSFFDLDNIQAMDQWRTRTLNHLRDAAILLVFASPNYFRSPFCYWEWQEFQRRLAGKLIGLEQVAVLHLSVADATEAAAASDRHPKLSAEQIQAWRQAVDAVQFFTLPSPHADDALAHTDTLLQALAEQLCERILRLRRARQRVGNLPRPHRLFVGRCCSFPSTCWCRLQHWEESGA